MSSEDKPVSWGMDTFKLPGTWCEFCGTSVSLDTEDDKHWPFETVPKVDGDRVTWWVHTPERCVERGGVW